MGVRHVGHMSQKGKKALNLRSDGVVAVPREPLLYDERAAAEGSGERADTLWVGCVWVGGGARDRGRYFYFFSYLTRLHLAHISHVSFFLSLTGSLCIVVHFLHSFFSFFVGSHLIIDEVVM